MVFIIPVGINQTNETGLLWQLRALYFYHMAEKAEVVKLEPQPYELQLASSRPLASDFFQRCLRYRFPKLLLLWTETKLSKKTVRFLRSCHP